MQAVLCIGTSVMVVPEGFWAEAAWGASGLSGVLGKE